MNKINYEYLHSLGFNKKEEKPERKIKVSNYRFKNDIETVLKNVLAYTEGVKFNEEEFESYKNEYVESFKKYYKNDIALVEFYDDIEYSCFTCDGILFYNVPYDCICLTDATDADFESIENYLEQAKEKLYSRVNLSLRELYYLAVSIEEYVFSHEEIFYYEIDDIEEY